MPPTTREEKEDAGDIRVTEGPGGALTVHLMGGLGGTRVAGLLDDLTARIAGRPFSSLTVDLEKVPYLDDFGALLLLELKRLALKRRSVFALVKTQAAVRETLSFLRFDAMDPAPGLRKKARPNTFVRLGERVLAGVSQVEGVATFIGEFCLALVHVCLHPRTLRREDTLLYMRQVGVDALPIVALISFLMGLIMAFMSSVQLQQFGANIYVASLVGLAMTRELGPIITAIIVAGRSGSSFAAEIGTMKVSEEVDALFAMGFDPVRFLVIPKVLAAITMLPILTLFSDLFAMVGGLLVGVSMLDLTMNAYIAQTLKTLSLFDLYWGFGKSAAFGLLISWVGCMRGFQVRGGAAAVGEATTSSVVSSLFLIIFFDSVFSVILTYWG